MPRIVGPPPSILRRGMTSASNELSFDSLQLADHYREFEMRYPRPDPSEDPSAYRRWLNERYESGRRFTRDYWNERRAARGLPPLRSYSPPRQASPPPIFNGFDPSFLDDDSSDSDF